VLPSLIEFHFDTAFSQAVAYLCSLLILAYGISSGWRHAAGKVDPRTGKEAPPTREARTQRAVIYGAIFAIVLWFGLQYALPASAPLGKRGEGLPLHTYGLLLVGGFMAAVAVAARLAEREWGGVEGIRRRNDALDLALWVFLGGVGGSKLLFIIVNWRESMEAFGSALGDPMRFIGFLGGGLVFYGGLIGASLAVWWFCRKRQLPFLRFADIIAPTVALGQAFGRLGCFSTGCCWGHMAGDHLSWAVRFPGPGVARDLFGRLTGNSAIAFASELQDTKTWVMESTGQVFHQAVPGAVRVSDWVVRHGTTLPLHPTQLYESFAQLLLFAGLMIFRSYKRFHGEIFALYLMFYAVIRSTVEVFRGDIERGKLDGFLHRIGADGLAAAIPPEAWWNFSISQFISLGMFAAGVALYLHGARKVQPLPPLAQAQPA
jgi:phosphatidylglycerol---prolipoprotein diacylglyceryl transferase